MDKRYKVNKGLGYLLFLIIISSIMLIISIVLCINDRNYASIILLCMSFGFLIYNIVILINKRKEFLMEYTLNEVSIKFYIKDKLIDEIYIKDIISYFKKEIDRINFVFIKTNYREIKVQENDEIIYYLNNHLYK